MKKLSYLLVATILMPGLAEAKGFVKKSLEVPGQTRAVTYGDLNGDGLLDLVVSYRRGAGPSTKRLLAVFLREGKNYPKRPNFLIRAPRNASVFDLGDALGGPADELVYLTAGGVYAQALEAGKFKAPVRILSSASLVGSPEEKELIHWNFLRTLKGIPEPVLLIPARRQLKLYKREKDSFQLWSSLSSQNLSYYDAETSTYRNTGRGGSSGRPYAFRVTTIVPNVDFVETNGDQKIDLVMQYEDRVAIYPQNEDGSWPKSPSWRYWYRLRTPKELQTHDSDISAVIKDIDGDNIADLALSKMSGGMTNLKSEVRLYRGIKGAGFSKKPSQVFKDEGFGTLTRYIDVDGDGKLEMVHPHSEVSIMAMTRMLISSSLSIDIRVRKAAAAPKFFVEKPVQVLTTEYGLDLSGNAAILGTEALMGHDFDQDGRNDAILSQGGEAMGFQRGLKKGSEPFEDEPSMRLSAPGSNTTIVINPGGGQAPEVLIYYVAKRDYSGTLYLFQPR